MFFTVVKKGRRWNVQKPLLQVLKSQFSLLEENLKKNLFSQVFISTQLFQNLEKKSLRFSPWCRSFCPLWSGYREEPSEICFGLCKALPQALQERILIGSLQWPRITWPFRCPLSCVSPGHWIGQEKEGAKPRSHGSIQALVTMCEEVPPGEALFIGCCSPCLPVLLLADHITPKDQPDLPQCHRPKGQGQDSRLEKEIKEL